MRQGCALAVLAVGSLGKALTAGAGWFGGYRINLTPSHGTVARRPDAAGSARGAVSRFDIHATGSFR